MNGSPGVEPGYYVANDQVYVVVLSKNQRTYAKRLVIHETANGGKRARWEYAPGVVYGLHGLEPLTIEKAKQLGHLHGLCVICTRQLTDPASVRDGIGPVCAKRLAMKAVAA